MARSQLSDLLQSHRFWLLDISGSPVPPFFVLGTPFLGFQAITAPEITLDMHEFKQVNSMWKDHVYEGGGASPITLSRGVGWWDNSMYNWLRRAIEGFDIVRRNLLLLHFTRVGADYDLAEALGISLPGVAPLDRGVFRVPGKAWILWNCIPTRYKAGSDFDSTSAEVSVAELDISPRAISELSLT